VYSALASRGGSMLLNSSLEAVGVGATEVDGDECVGLEHVIKLEAIEIGG
jgi:hypothetical protein